MEIIFVIFVIALLALVVRLVVGEIIFNKHKVQPWKPLVVARQLKSNRGVNNSDLAWYVKEYASHHGTQTLKVIHENRRSMKVAIPKGGRFSISFWSISSDVDPVLHVKTYWTGKQTASQKTAQYTYWQVLSILERPTTTETKQMERRKMTRELRQEILKRDNYTCAHCGYRTTQNMAGLHIDHIKAINKGGLTTPSNLQVLCATCNIKKKDK